MGSGVTLIARGDGDFHRGHRDSQRESQQVRVRPRDARDQARPLPVRLGRLSDGLRIHSGHALARRRSARRDGLRLRADVPRLRDRGQADRAVPDGGRPGRRRQGAGGPVLGSDLEPAVDARGHQPAVAGRDRPLLLRLQGPRAEEGHGSRLVLARRCDRGDQGVARALSRWRQRPSPGEPDGGELMKMVRNWAIIALIALAIVALPGGGPALRVTMTILSIAFLGGIALFAIRLYRENRFTIDWLTDRQRFVLYASIGVAMLNFTATSRLFNQGGLGILVWLALLGACSYGVMWVWVSYRSYS